MSDATIPKICDRETLELVNAPQNSQLLSTAPRGPDLLNDLLTQFDQARNLYRGKQFGEAESVLRTVIEKADALLNGSAAPPDLNIAATNLLAASAQVLLKLTAQNSEPAQESDDDWKGALDIFTRYIVQDHPSAEAWGYYGIALFTAKRYPEAIPPLKKAIDSGSSIPELHRFLAFAFKEDGQYSEAEKEFHKAITRARSDIVARCGLAETLELEKRPQDAAAAYCEAAGLLLQSNLLPRALQVIDNAIRVDGNCPKVYAYRADILRLLGRREEALEACNRGLQLDQNNAPAYLVRAAILLEYHRLPEALASVELALSIIPEDGSAFALKGHLLFLMGQNQEAIPCLEKALPWSPQSAADLARIFFASGETERALTVVESALLNFPGDPTLHATKGEALRLRGQPQDALAAFSEALQRAQGNYPYALAMKALLLHSLGRFAEAREPVEQALEQLPDYPVALTIKGMVLAELGTLDESIQFLKRAVELQPDFLMGLVELGTMLQRVGSLDQALEFTTRALQLQPQLPQALANQGEILRRQAKYQEALAPLETALSINPRWPFALGTKARILRSLMQTREALHAFELALNAAPNAPWILAELADTLEELGEADKAHPARLDVLSTSLSDPYSQIAKGQALHGLGRDEEAIPVLEAVIAGSPNLVFAREIIAEVFRIRRDYEQALAHANFAISIEPTSVAALVAKGRCCLALGQQSEAISALHQALKLNPRLEQVLSELLELQHSVGCPEKALESLRDTLSLVPQSQFAISAATRLLCEFEQFELALRISELAIAWHSSMSLLHIFRGWALEHMRKTAAARDAYLEASRLDPHDVWSRRGVADTMRELGNEEEARKEYRSIIENIPETASDPSSLSLLGWCHFGRGEFPQALRFYTEALSVDKAPCSRQFDLALILAASNRGDVSLREYKRGVELSKREDPLFRCGLLNIALFDLDRAKRVKDLKQLTPARLRRLRETLQPELVNARVEAEEKLKLVQKVSAEIQQIIQSASSPATA